MEILVRLPAKSAIRLKGMSKSWSSLLSSRYFCNRFLMFPSWPQTPLVYMSLSDIFDSSKSLLLSSFAAAPSSSSVVVLDQDMTIPKMGCRYLCVLHGLICFTVCKSASIYNPTTRQLVILPVINSDILYVDVKYYIGHDPINYQYKILCTTIAVTHSYGRLQKIRSEHLVFVLEAGGLWKRVAKEFHHHHPSTIQLTMNGVLYYLAWTDDVHTWVVVSFDMRSEEFDMMQVPRIPGAMLPRRMSLIDYGGKLAFFYFTYIKERGAVDVSVVEEWRKEEWSRKTVVLQPSQMHLVLDDRFNTKGTTLKNKVILVPQNLVSPFYFLCYDMQINDLKKVEIKGIPDHWFELETTRFDMEFMDPSENIMYLETCDPFLVL